MKAIALETGDFAVAVMPGGGVEWAPCAEALGLKLATVGIEPEEWRPEGKAGLKAAVLAALGSADPAAAMRSFCAAYLAAGKPEGAYACWMEICFAGGKKFGPGRAFDVNRAESCGKAYVDVVKELSKISVRSRHWKYLRREIWRAVKGKSPEDIVAAFADGENASWDEKDAEDALRAALANPALK